MLRVVSQVPPICRSRCFNPCLTWYPPLSVPLSHQLLSGCLVRSRCSDTWFFSLELLPSLSLDHFLQLGRSEVRSELQANHRLHATNYPYLPPLPLDPTGHPLPTGTTQGLAVRVCLWGGVLSFYYITRPATCDVALSLIYICTLLAVCIASIITIVCVSGCVLQQAIISSDFQKSPKWTSPITCVYIFHRF